MREEELHYLLALECSKCDALDLFGKTIGQSESDLWHRERKLRITASGKNS